MIESFKRFAAVDTNLVVTIRRRKMRGLARREDVEYSRGKGHDPRAGPADHPQPPRRKR